MNDCIHDKNTSGAIHDTPLRFRAHLKVETAEMSYPPKYYQIDIYKCRCDKCGEFYHVIHPWHWSPQSGYSPIVPPFTDPDDKIWGHVYRDYDKIIALTLEKYADKLAPFLPLANMSEATE